MAEAVWFVFFVSDWQRPLGGLLSISGYNKKQEDSFLSLSIRERRHNLLILYCPDKSPMNCDVDARPDVYRLEMGNIREYTYPDVNLAEDTDKHFSYPTNEVGLEMNASPEDYNGDIDFNEDLDDVLNQDESDSDRNSVGTSHDSIKCVNGLSYQQEVLECNRLLCKSVILKTH
ncbi:hypothetical protein MRB53_006576 [Persea americana]|uniref:Uncharacterized protein n=1 Tax=Persea americana TaxID=3435 RepID=A0ACC2MGT3_PERAE|nr:hypothetical protein MRB53_006576 [Persea americana]